MTLQIYSKVLQYNLQVKKHKRKTDLGLNPFPTAKKALYPYAMVADKSLEWKICLHRKLRKYPFKAGHFRLDPKRCHIVRRYM